MNTPPQQTSTPSPGQTRREHRARAALALAPLHHGLMHRADLRRLGVNRDDVRSEVRAGRWTVRGRHTVQVGTGELGEQARLELAVWESGSGAALDGAAALVAHGLTGLALARIDVSLPRHNRRRRLSGVRVHYRTRMPHLWPSGLARVHPASAAVHAALWARSDRQGALVLCLVLQQGIVRPRDLAATWAERGTPTTRPALAAVVADLTDGARSLGELDFARLCRRAGLPRPSRQVLRLLPGGRVYLDACWEDIGLAVEIDGGHHAMALNPVADALRQNDVVIGTEMVLRVPVLGLRLHEAMFMAQVVRAHERLTRQQMARGRAQAG